MTLRDMGKLLPVSITIYIVQAGIPKGNPSAAELGTPQRYGHYLWETYQVKLGVIGSN